MTAKKLKIPKDRIEEYVYGGGGGWASDRILVDGRKVGLMRRERPSSPKDSGWRFFAGNPSREDRRSKVDVNVVANYDADILPLLYEEPGAVFKRSKGGRLLPQGPLPPSPLLRLTAEWSARIPSFFQRREEQKKQIFWGMDRSVWISFSGPKRGESPAQRLNSLRRRAARTSQGRYEPDHPTLKRFATLDFENDDGKTSRWGLHATTVDPTGGHLQMYVSFEREDAVEWALRIWDSVEFTGR